VIDPVLSESWAADAPLSPKGSEKDLEHDVKRSDEGHCGRVNRKATLVE